MNKKYLTGIFALAIVGLLAVSLVAANQFGNGIKPFAPSEDDRDAMRAAIESKDYSAWKALMEQRVEEIKSQITEENFNKMVELHQNMNQTDMPRMHMGNQTGEMKFQRGSCPMAG